MIQLSAAVRPPLHSRPTAALGEVDRLLSDGRGSRNELKCALEGLSEAELNTLGLRAYKLNLLSLFGQRWSEERIARTARAAAIGKLLGGWDYHHAYLPRLGGDPAPPELSGLPVELLRELLARRRGALLVSFHLGPMRYVASDVAHAGIPICTPLASDAFGDYASARAANPDAAVWCNLRIVNVEEAGGVIALAKTLAGGGLIGSTIDGNTGLDGPKGNQRRVVVSLFDSRAKVKTGLLDLAARFGAPVLIVIARDEVGPRSCRPAHVVDPGGPLRGDAAEHFAASAAQTAYSLFADALEEQAHEWSGGDHFHQWYVPKSGASRPPADAERWLRDALDGGRRLVLNRHRIVPIDENDGRILSDAVSARCYRLPAEALGVADRLASAPGLDLAWLQEAPASQRERWWSLLSQLAARDVLIAVEGGGEDTNQLTGIARPSVHGTAMID